MLGPQKIFYVSSLIRVVIRILLRRHAGLITDQDWRALLSLEDHVEKIKKQGNTRDGENRWATVQLTARMVGKYARAEQGLDFLEILVAKVRNILQDS